MRNLKKILALVLALVMSFSLMATANAFTDDAKITATYDEAVEVLNALKVFQGYDDGSFQPQGSITRAEVATIIYRIVTGDVEDKQVGIYADYNKFNDVKSTSWYAGYVNFCANAEYIKGYDAKTFGPNDPVTGYQALAMILRAVGYDKNGEFTGSDWQVQTAAVGKKLGVTNNVTEGTLNTAASREVVAEILFQTIQVPQVEYTVAFGYQSIGQVSIGYETFGLASTTGVVTANQATGSAATMIAKDFASASVGYGYKSDLNLIGHSVKVWYDARVGAKNAVYLLMDKSTAETVLTAAELVGKVNADTYYSYNYGAFAKTAHTPGVSKYIVIDGGKTVISVDEYVAKIYAINNYAVTPTVTLTESVNGVKAEKAYKQSVLTGFDKDTMAVGDIVMVTQINNGVYTNLVELTKTVKGAVRFYDAQGNITLADGTVLNRTAQKVYASATVIGLSQVEANQLQILKNYVFLLDNDGRYVGCWPAQDNYIFGTYAYYTVDNAATAQLSYYLTGVTADGQVVTKKITGDQAAGYNSAFVQGGNGYVAIPNLSTQQQAIAAAGNVGQDRALVETTTTDLYTLGACPATHIGDITARQADASITKNTVAIGEKYNYFIDEATKFYFVSGTAAEPQVQEVVGKTALLGSGDVYVLPADSVITTTVTNYSVSVAANYHVDTVLVKAPYAANAAADLYYINGNDNFYSGTPVANGAYQIAVHKNAKLMTPILVTNDPAVLDDNFPAFYTHTTNAIGVETLTRVADATGVIKAYYGYKINRYGTSDLYLTQDNVAGNPNAIVNRIADNAVIVDLRPNTVTSDDAVRGYVGTSQLAEITDVATLISRAAEYKFTVDAAGTAGGVTIVYITGAQIRDLTNVVTFEVWKDGAKQNVALDDYITILSGALSGSGVGYNGTVDFQLKDKAANATVTTSAGTQTFGSKVINNQLYYNVYTVSGIVTPVTIKITLPDTPAVNMLEGVKVDTQIAPIAGAYNTVKDAIANATAISLSTSAAQDYEITVNTKLVGGTTPCYGGMSVFTDAVAAAGYTYQSNANFNNNPVTFKNVAPGNYLIINTNNNGVIAYYAYYFTV